MLYISKYDKYNLDKSSQSMYAYYTRLINDINTDVLEIRDYLVSMLDVVADLRTRLYDIKDSIQEDLDTTKDAYKEAGYTNKALDQVQEILDGVEENLGNLEGNINDTIESIDCNQDCAYCEYCEYEAGGCLDVSDIDTPVCEYDNPICVYDPDIPNLGDCSYCQFSDQASEDECSVCSHGDCKVNYDCDQTLESPGTVPSCYYETTFDPDCHQIGGINKSCEERSCTYSGNDPSLDTCTFTCAWSGSACGETSVSGCTFNCTDGSPCSYDTSCDQCSFNSTYLDPNCWQGGPDCSEDCIFNDSTCTYDSSSSCSYDSAAGYDYGCDEWVDPDEMDDDDDDSESSSDADSNVVCTYIIKRMFNNDSKLREMSRENVKIGLRNGLSKKAFKEYYNGLGLEIIKYLEKESDNYLIQLWDTDIQEVWTLLRTKPKEGVIRYTKFIIDQAEHYNIDWHKYKNIEKFRDNL